MNYLYLPGSEKSAPEPVCAAHLQDILPFGIEASESDERSNVLTIAAVGVSYSRENGFDAERDKFWLGRILSLVMEERIFNLTAAVCVTPYDLKHRHDILNPNQKVRPADIFLVCYVPHPRNEYEHEKLICGRSPDFAASRYALMPNAWTKAAARAQAKMIATYVFEPCNPVEVAAEHFAGGAYHFGGAVRAEYVGGNSRLKIWMQTLFSVDFAKDLCRRAKDSVFCKDFCPLLDCNEPTLS